MVKVVDPSDYIVYLFRVTFSEARRYSGDGGDGPMRYVPETPN